MPQVFSFPLTTMENVRHFVSNATSDSQQWNAYFSYVAAGLYTARQIHNMVNNSDKGNVESKKPLRRLKSVGHDGAKQLVADPSHIESSAVANPARLIPLSGPIASSSNMVTSAGKVQRAASFADLASFSNGNGSASINLGSGQRKVSVSLARQASFAALKRHSVGNLEGLSSPSTSRSNQPAFPAATAIGKVSSDDEDCGAFVSQPTLAFTEVASPTTNASVGFPSGINPAASCSSVDMVDEASEGPTKREGMYVGFWNDIFFLVKIGFGGTLRGKEVLLLISYISVILIRTIVATRIVFIDGEMLQAVIAKDKKALMRALTIWMLMGIPTAIINTLLRYVNQTFALALRTNINHYLTEKYFKSQAYYKISPVGGRRKAIANVDQAVSDDVELWSKRFSNLLSFLGRPAFDMGFYSSMLFRNFGFWNQFAGMVASYEVGKLLQFVRPNFSEAIQVTGALEGQFRAAHSKIVAGAEEIAFSGGEAREKSVVQKCYNNLREYATRTYAQNFRYFCCEEYVTRYCWSTISLLQVAFIAFRAQLPAAETAKRVVVMRRIMAKNGSATEKFLRGVKLIQEFAGLTSSLMSVFNALHRVELAASADAARTDLRQVANCECTDFAVEDLVVATPSNEILIPSLSFRLKQHDRLLVLGPNGCGKSSLFRVLCGLWPQRGGKIHLPKAPLDRRDGVFFLPQKPYVMRGTLREQLHYPDAAVREGFTDIDLMGIIDCVKLRYLVDNVGGLDVVEDWGEILSGGEKQRIGLARIFYHRPLYAVLDECSSAINVDAEQTIFQRLCESGTTLITISHRQSLQKFHNKLLIFDSEGGYTFEANGAEKGEELSALKQQREQLIAELDKVVKGLGEDWPAGPKAVEEEGDMDDDDLEMI